MDFRNNMQKVYVTDEQKEKVMEKLNRDVEVGDGMERSTVLTTEGQYKPSPNWHNPVNIDLPFEIEKVE